MRSCIAVVALVMLPLGRASAGVCVADATVNDLLDPVLLAEDAIADRSSENLEAAFVRTMAVLECLRDPLGPSMAAMVHRVAGLHALVNRGDSITAERAFLAARTIDPAYTLPTDRFPPGGKIALAYDALPAGVAREGVPRARTERLFFDGTETDERPLGVPTIFQRLDARGDVVGTWYLPAGSAVPYYQPAAEADEPERTPVRLPRVLEFGGGAVALVGLGLLGFGIADCWGDPDRCADDGVWAQDSALMYGGGALAGVGLVGSGLGLYLDLKKGVAGVQGTF